MKRPLARIAIATLGAACTLAHALRAADTVPLRDWQVPPRAAAIHVLADAGNPAIFVPFAPCRMADTRGPGFSGAYGPPSLPGSGTRTMPVPSNPSCTGIPAGAAAVSLNVTVTNTTGDGDLRVFPAGAAAPLVSTLNYRARQTVANAAIVPLGTSGGITIQADVSGTDVIVDLNGYFIDSGGIFNVSEPLWVRGTVDGGGMLFVKNLSNVAGSYSISASIDSTTDDSAAVYAVLTGSGLGHNSAVHGVNKSTAFNMAGLYGYAGPTNAAFNLINEMGVDGVLGIASTSPSFGLSAGVVGASRDNGVSGFHVDASAAVKSQGSLGYSDTDGIYTPDHLTAVGGKSFAEPHPTDPSKVIKYVCPEGPESGTYFRGRGRFVGHVAVIEVPDHFRTVTDEEGLTVQVTPIGELAMVVVSRIGLDRIEVRSNRDVEFSFLVNGVRRAYRDWQPVQGAAENPYFIPRSARERLRDTWAPEIKRRLIESGIYNPDGTVNMETAERMGWARSWREGEQQRRGER